MTTKYCLVLLFGVVLFSTASVLADHHDPPKHENKPPTYHDKPPKGEKPPPKHKPPTLLDNEDKKPFPEHKPPTHGHEEPPKGKGKGDKPPPHDHHPGRLLLESQSLDEQNSPSLAGKPPAKGEKSPPKQIKPPPKHKPPTTLNRGEKPFPEHKPPTHGREEPPKGKGKGDKPPPHDHHPGRLLLESKSLDEQNSPSLKPVPEHKPPTHGREEPPKGKGKGEKPPPEHKPPHGDHPAVEDVEDSHKAPRKLKPPTVEKKPPTHSHKPPHKPPHAN